jgi:hypothetical protein
VSKNGILAVQTPVLKPSNKFIFYAFGLNIQSDWDIPCSKTPHSTFSSVRLVKGTEQFFAQRVPADIRRRDLKRITLEDLADGSRYLGWRDIFEFHISADSRTVTGLSLDGAPEAAFRTYMLGHLISYVLLGLGIETLHAASIVIDGEAIGILGDSARGKSTLSAAFLQAGYSLLTDDFLVLIPSGEDFVAYPGFPRIKLYEQVARHLIAEDQKGTPMTPHRRTKMIYPLEGHSEPVRLRALYSLASPKAVVGRKDVKIELLSEREAYLDLTENSFNARVKTPQRLASQFQWATNVVKKIPVKRLSYPRVMHILPDVIRAVKEDLADQAARPSALANTLPNRTK